jgi:hypothetical protein
MSVEGPIARIRLASATVDRLLVTFQRLLADPRQLDILRSVARALEAGFRLLAPREARCGASRLK